VLDVVSYLSNFLQSLYRCFLSDPYLQARPVVRNLQKADVLAEGEVAGSVDDFARLLKRCGPNLVETEMCGNDLSQVVLDFADSEERFSDILEQNAQVRAGYKTDDSLRLVSDHL
jgi:hypothetical protein